MSYRWATLPELPAAVADELAVGDGFATQAQAEAWLTEHYLDLSGSGVQSVLLVEGGRVVYGPMSLSQ